MSLNSLQDDMSRRAASMAAMAKRANNPQEIQAIQQSLVAGVQNGSIQPYVGIPLIQDLTKKLAEATAKMAQTVAGAGMPQPPAGGPPIAQQVMQQAAQESQGVEALPSNLPQSYAGGGIIAFEDGGKVETSPAGRFFSGLGQNFSEANEAAKLRNKLQMRYGPKSALPGLFMKQSDEERQTAKDIVGRLGTMTLPQLQALYDQGPSALPSATPAVAPYDPATATRRSQYTNDPIPATPGAATAPPAAPSAAIPGAGNFKMPTLAGMTMAPVPGLTDYKALIGDMPAKTKAAFDKAVTASQRELEGFDEPGNAAREEKYSKREAAQEKDSAIGRALNMIRLGFGVAGSREGTLAGALNKEGREGITALIQGEAANRAAKDKLDDARDNFEQQKVAAKKGNYQAAQTAGREASRDLQTATQLGMTAANYGSTEAMNRYQIQQQGNYQQATLNNQGVLGLSELELKKRQLNQSAASANATLRMNEKRYAAMDAASKARLQGVLAKGINDFMQNEGGMLRAQLAEKYGPDFMTAKDARSLEARQIFNQRKQAYLADITGQAMDAMSARSADALLGD